MEGEGARPLLFHLHCPHVESVKSEEDRPGIQRFSTLLGTLIFQGLKSNGEIPYVVDSGPVQTGHWGGG